MEKQQNKSRRVVCFKRWTRKSYAVFNSLGRNIQIGVLSLSCSILTLPGFSQEQPDSSRTVKTERELELSEVVVSAQRVPLLQSQLMRTVQVITRAEIEQAASTDLAGLLEHIRGVDIRQRGAFGMQADVSLRGGSFDQTLILLNGVNLSDPQTGHHNLNLPVDLSSISRIEVLQGPGARVFGPNAFNGVINIITGEPGRQSLTASFSAGQFNYFQGSIGGSFYTGKFHHHLSASSVKSSGYITNTDFKNENIYYRALMPVLDAFIDVQAGYTNRAFGANSFYSPKYPDQFEQTRTHILALKFLPAKINLRPSIYWRRHHDRFELFRNEAPSWYKGHNYHMTDVAGASLNWMTSGKVGKTSFGLDYRFEHIYSNVLGETLDSPRIVNGEPGQFFTKSFQRESVSFMGEQVFIHGPYSASVGVLIHMNESLPDGFSIYPGLDLGWQISPTIRLYTSANRTLRLPTFTDLFYSGPTNIGNPDLKPEEAISIETGLKATAGIVNAEFTVYRRYGKNMIDWVKFPGNEKWQSLNLTSINITGLEAGINLTFQEKSIVRNTGLHYTWLDASKKSDDFTSMYVLDNLRHKIDLNLGHRITRNSGVDWKFTWQDRDGGYQPFTDGLYEGEISYKPVLLVDARAYYNYKIFQVFAEATNLTDANVIDHANVPQAGRWVRAGIKIKILVPEKKQ